MKKNEKSALRLDKYLANAGLGTRSEVKKYIKNGWVTVGEEAAAGPEQKIRPLSDAVYFRGEPVVCRSFSYYLFHKPAGCVTARSDSRERTVMDYFPEELRALSPVGRLDKDTEGLLLVTDDGALNHHLTSPAHSIAKTYYAVLDAPVPEDAGERFAQGVDIGDERPTKPAVLEVLPQSSTAEVFLPNGVSDAAAHARLTITEGRYHQVKRMFAAVGCKVLYLKRLSLGTLTLDKLAPGEYRALSEDEVAELKRGGPQSGSSQ